MTDWDTANAVIALGAKAMVAPKATTLPTYTGDAPNAAFKTLGAVSENGMTVTPSRDTEAKKIWQSRADVLIVPKGQAFEIKHELVEWTPTTFGLWYGGGTWVEDGTHSGNFRFDVSGDPAVDERAFFYEWTVSTYIWRLVIPRGQITAVGDAKLVNNDWTPVETTIQALKTDGQPLAFYLTNDPSVDPAP